MLWSHKCAVADKVANPFNVDYIMFLYHLLHNSRSNRLDSASAMILLAKLNVSLILKCYFCTSVLSVAYFIKLSASIALFPLQKRLLTQDFPQYKVNLMLKKGPPGSSHFWNKVGKKKKPHSCHANLQYEWWCGFEFQYSRGTQWFKHRVRVVAEGLIDHHQSIHIVHVETNFIWTRATLRKPQFWVCDGGGQAHHDGVVVHRAVLEGNRRKTHVTTYHVTCCEPVWLICILCFNIINT